MLLLVVISVISKFQDKINSKAKKTFSILMILSMFVVVSGMIGTSIIYRPENVVLEWINKLSNDRLYFGKRGFVEYGISLWGKEITMQGLSGIQTSDVIQIDHPYFMLDCSYVNILLQFGAVLFMVLEAMLVIMLFRLFKYDRHLKIILTVIMCIQCVFEHHYIEIAYNPIILLAMAGFTPRYKLEIK